MAASRRQQRTESKRIPRRIFGFHKNSFARRGHRALFQFVPHRLAAEPGVMQVTMPQFAVVMKKLIEAMEIEDPSPMPQPLAAARATPARAAAAKSGVILRSSYEFFNPWREEHTSSISVIRADSRLGAKRHPTRCGATMTPPATRSLETWLFQLRSFSDPCRLRKSLAGSSLFSPGAA